MSRRIIEPETFGDNNMDEYTTHDEPQQPSFYDRHGPSEEEEDEDLIT